MRGGIHGAVIDAAAAAVKPFARASGSLLACSGAYLALNAADGDGASPKALPG
jgi:hypothetical protein